MNARKKNGKHTKLKLATARCQPNNRELFFLVNKTCESSDIPTLPLNLLSKRAFQCHGTASRRSIVFHQSDFSYLLFFFGAKPFFQRGLGDTPQSTTCVECVSVRSSGHDCSPSQPWPRPCCSSLRPWLRICLSRQHDRSSGCHTPFFKEPLERHHNPPHVSDLFPSVLPAITVRLPSRGLIHVIHPFVPGCEFVSRVNVTGLLLTWYPSNWFLRCWVLPSSASLFFFLIRCTFDPLHLHVLLECAQLSTCHSRRHRSCSQVAAGPTI